MRYEWSRRLARLPRWLRRVLAAGVGLAGTVLVVGLLAVVAQGLDDFHPFGLRWEWASTCLFGALTLLAGVFGNAAYDRFQRWEASRLPVVSEFFRNHDLARLVGQAIGMTLRASADGLSAPDARLVYALAGRAERDWPNLAGGKRVRRLLGSLSEGQLVAFIRDPTRPALTEAQADLLHPQNLGAAPAFTDPASAPKVRGALIGRFGEALRQAAKRDFGRGGQGFAALWLDLAGALLNDSAAALPRTDDNAHAIAEVRITLTAVSALPAADAAGLRPAMDGLADRLDATYHAVRAEGRASARRHGHTRRWLIGIVILIGVVGGAAWYGQQRTHTTVEQGQQDTVARLTAIETQLREALAPRQAGEDPTQRQLPPELIAQAGELLARGDREQQAVAQIALGQHDEADRLIQDLKREPLADAFRLLTLDGDNQYNAGEFDRAIGPYEQAAAMRPDDPDGLNQAAIAHGQARLGDMAAHQHRAIDAYAAALTVSTRETHPVAWATTQNNLGNAWSDLPTGDRAENLQRAIDAYTAALTVYTREALPAGWAMTRFNLGRLFWDRAGLGDARVDPTADLTAAIAQVRAAAQVWTETDFPFDYQNRIAPTLEGLRTAWLAGGHGSAADSEAIAPAQ